ncbi:MAG TPA: carboxypeptidase-like regulatory domain-containing protein [Actinomycetes bacterium]|nr:carboxypeptidase-like regulatory domain-containing protein [Actinomycetes bacterium]
MATTKRWTTVVGVGLAALALTACGSSQAGPSASSATVSGQVLTGPTCPVETVESPCPPSPLDGAKVEVLQDGAVVSDGTSDSDGGFSLDAPAGSVVVRATDTNGLHSQASKTVQLEAGQTTTVTLVVDSGIR